MFFVQEGHLKTQQDPTIRLIHKIAPLFDQQLWCWGCDVRRPMGNLLLAYGAEKRSAPDPRYHSTYIFRTGMDGTISLWGWGLWIAQKGTGSLFISRANFRLSYTSDVIPVSDAWQPGDLPKTRSLVSLMDEPEASELLAGAFDWTGQYESWLSEQVESDYRSRVIEQWPQRRRNRGGIPAQLMARRWYELGQIIRQTHCRSSYNDFSSIIAQVER